MARLINYFELKQRILEERSQIPAELNVHNNAMRGGIRKALRCLEQCQSVTDMVEVVRCKDCLWFDYEDELPDVFRSEQHCYCTEANTYVPINHFCSYGERRTDG